jgi:rRNA maturation RNase YbeY
MPSIKILNDYPEIYLLRPAIEKISCFVANCEKVTIRMVTIIATDDQTLSDMKINFFGEDLLTDTISFNYNEPGEPIEGEIYLSIDRIKENASLYSISFEKELVMVIVHSLLHLVGYCDDTISGRKQMAALQNLYCQKLDLRRLYRRRPKQANKN